MDVVIPPALVIPSSLNKDMVGKVPFFTPDKRPVAFEGNEGAPIWRILGVKRQIVETPYVVIWTPIEALCVGWSKLQNCTLVDFSLMEFFKVAVANHKTVSPLLIWNDGDGHVALTCLNFLPIIQTFEKVSQVVCAGSVSELHWAILCMIAEYLEKPKPTLATEIHGDGFQRN